MKDENIKLPTDRATQPVYTVEGAMASCAKTEQEGVASNSRPKTPSAEEQEAAMELDKKSQRRV